MAKSRLCSIPECGKPHYARDLCRRHYSNARYHGLDVMPMARDGEPMAFAVSALNAATDDCIIWPYGKRHDYGILVLGKGKKVPTHRWVCEQTHGPAPEGNLACHSCDVRSCINPRHLRWGTVQDNHDDCGKRLRRLWGEKNPQAVLTFDQVTEIRASKESRPELARRYGVSEAAILDVDRGLKWQRAPDGTLLKLERIYRPIDRVALNLQLARARARKKHSPTG